MPKEYAKRAEGIYLLYPRPYRGQPRFERRDYKNRRWTIYRRTKQGMWVVDFNRVSQSWSGTIAYSMDQPNRKVTNVEWEDFRGLKIEAVDASELGAEAWNGLVSNPASFALNASAALQKESAMEDEEDGEEEAMTAEDGSLVTIPVPPHRMEHKLTATGASLDAVSMAVGVVCGVAAAGLILLFGVLLYRYECRNNTSPKVTTTKVNLTPPSSDSKVKTTTPTNMVDRV